MSIENAEPEIGDILAEFTEATNKHDLDLVMSFFAPDCVYRASFGPGKHGNVYEGSDAVRAALAASLEDTPDGRYEDVSWFGCGDRGALRWTFIGTSQTTGERIEIRGCDFFEFEGRKIKVKDAFRKERTNE